MLSAARSVLGDDDLVEVDRVRLKALPDAPESCGALKL
jgi:hypothetical protein